MDRSFGIKIEYECRRCATGLRNLHDEHWRVSRVTIMLGRYEKTVYTK
jgi:hypothetical protein